MGDKKRQTKTEDITKTQEPTRTCDTTTKGETGSESVVQPEDDKAKDIDEQRNIFFGAEQQLKGYEDVPKWISPDFKRPPLIYGCEITTETNKYRVCRRLGSGGFGDVYSVKRATDGALLALKSEFHTKDNMLQRLKREVLFYEVVNATRREDPAAANWILYMVDRGHNPWFKYLVMPYTGKSLDLIRENILKRQFQQHTAIKICWMTHVALKHMHQMNYIHRDVKLDNFVVGKEHHRNELYIMDFGMATNYTLLTKEEKDRKNNKKTKERMLSEYGFIGTDEFAARSVHQGYVAYRKDDMESWLYMCMDAFGSNYLPWKGINSKNKIYFLKNKFFAGEFDAILKPCLPKQIFNLRSLIEKMNAEDERPKYEEHERELADMIKQYKVDVMASWEWADDVALRMDEAEWNEL